MHSVREFIERAFLLRGFCIKWSGDGVNEVGIDEKTEKVLVRIDPKYFRPSEVEQLLGDATKARKELGWTPKIQFHTLVERMVAQDCGGEA